MTVTRTVVPGDWYGVLGDDVIVLLPPSAKSRVAGLWETVDDGAGFDVVLDALISRGLRELPGFVLVAREGGDVKVVIRGPGEAQLRTSDGSVTVRGSGDTTWVEENVDGVTALSIRVADGTGAAYSVGPGLVRVASVEQPAASTVAVSMADAEAVAVPVEPPTPPQAPTPPGPPTPPEPPRRARILPPDPQLEKPEPPPEPVAPPAGAALPAATTPGTLGGLGFDPLTSPDLAVPIGETADTQPGGHVAPRPAGEGEASGAPVARLMFSSGQVVEVDRAVVVGRAPDQGRFGRDDRTTLVTVPSPHHEISSTHLEIRPGTGADQGSAVVTDLGSTNGTVVVLPGLPAEDLQPGVAVQLVPGATIDLGEGVTIQVTGA